MFRRTVHPGEVLRAELGDLGVSAAALAEQIDVPEDRLAAVIGGEAAIDGDVALRLGHWFGMDPQFWLNLQSQHDLARAEAAHGAAIRNLPTRNGPTAGC